jgi:hypothetical protein
MQQAGLRSSRADLKVHLDNLHQLYNSTNEEVRRPCCILNRLAYSYSNNNTDYKAMFKKLDLVFLLTPTTSCQLPSSKIIHLISDSQVFSRLGLLSPHSKRPDAHNTLQYPTSPLVTAAALMEEEEKDSAPRQFTRPRPTGNLFFYRPQNEASTPLEQAQLASGPLSTPDSPSMVCSAGSGIEEEEEEGDDGWSCHKKEQTVKSKAREQQLHVKETFTKAFPYPIPSMSNHTNNPVVKKDTAALDLILKKAAIFLSPLPQEKENEEEEEDLVVVAEGQEQITPGVIPRCLAFDDDEETNLSKRSIDEEEQRVPPPPVIESILPPLAAVTDTRALNRLKQITLERQSSQVAALSKLKQLTVQKQRHRITAMRPSSAACSTSTAGHSNSGEYNPYSKINNNSASVEKEVDCFIKNPLMPPPAKQGRSFAAVVPPTENQPRTAAAAAPIRATTEAERTTGNTKPYLKRRSQAIPMQHQGLPDWSAVKSRTQSKLDSNLILKNYRPSSGTSIRTRTGGAPVARPGQNLPRGYRELPGGENCIETMEHYTAKFNNPNSQKRNIGGGGGGSNYKNSVAPPPLNRNTWGSNRPSTAPSFTTSSTGPLSSAAAAGSLAQAKSRSISGAQRRAVLRATPFDPSSNVVALANKNDVAGPGGSRTAAYGPLGAAAVAAGGNTGYKKNHHYYQQQEQLEQQEQHSHRSHSDTTAHPFVSNHQYHEIGHYEDPLRPLVSQVDELLNSVGRAIRR